MLKKICLLINIPAAFFYLKAQDVSVITNTADVYSGNPISGSAKFNSMAGSMGALGGDISSSSVNPAGIGVFITSDVSFTLGVTNYKNTTTFAGTSIDAKNNKTDISNAGGVLSIDLTNSSSNWKFVNIGFNYSSQVLDNYSLSAGNQNIKILDDFSYPDKKINYTYFGHQYGRTGDLSKTNVTVGANYDNRLYFGVGLNFHNSYLQQYDSADFSADNRNSVLSYNKQYTDFAENSNGFSANIGMIARVGNQFRFGAAVETPTWWSLDRAFNQYYFGNNQYDTYNEDRRFSSPMKVSLSAAFVPSKNFSLNVDYIQGVTKPKYHVDGTPESDLNDFFSSQYKNTSEVRAGAEYRIAGFRLRGGYAYQGNNFDNMSFLAYNNDGSASNQAFSNLFVGQRNVIGAGIGYDFKAFYIDAAYQNVSSKYKSPFLQGNPDDNSGYFNGGYDVNSDAYAVSDVKTNKNNFFVTLGWKF